MPGGDCFHHWRRCEPPENEESPVDVVFPAVCVMGECPPSCEDCIDSVTVTHPPTSVRRLTDGAIIEISGTAVYTRVDCDWLLSDFSGMTATINGNPAVLQMNLGEKYFLCAFADKGPIGEGLCNVPQDTVFWLFLYEFIVDGFRLSLNYAGTRESAECAASEYQYCVSNFTDVEPIATPNMTADFGGIAGENTIYTVGAIYRITEVNDCYEYLGIVEEAPPDAVRLQEEVPTDPEFETCEECLPCFAEAIPCPGCPASGRKLFVPCSEIPPIPIIFQFDGFCWLLTNNPPIVPELPPDADLVENVQAEFDSCGECCGLEGACTDCDDSCPPPPVCIQGPIVQWQGPPECNCTIPPAFGCDDRSPCHSHPDGISVQGTCEAGDTVPDIGNLSVDCRADGLPGGPPCNPEGQRLWMVFAGGNVPRTDGGWEAIYVKPSGLCPQGSYAFCRDWFAVPGSCGRPVDYGSCVVT